MSRLRELKRMLGLMVLVLLATAGRWWSQDPGQAERSTIANDPWAEVITVTKDWLVLQNGEGQQLPVATGAIRLFVIRWPTTPDRISPNALLETTGVDTGSLHVATNHVDVYEGATRALVTPATLYITASGRPQFPIDLVYNSDPYGEAIYGSWPLLPSGFSGGPARMNIVGPMVSRNPLAIGVVPGNNAAVIMPASPAGVTMSQITPGSNELVRPAISSTSSRSRPGRSR